jgi:hypothetical protein
MKNILLGLQLTLLMAFGASVTAKVDNTEVVRGGSVELTLEARGDDVKFPTIDRVGDYVVESISNMSKSSYRIINNRSSQEILKEQVIRFTPDINMTIPPFEIEVDNQKLMTKAIEIVVVDSKAPTPNGSAKFTLSMKSNKSTLYVGEPTLLSIYFSVRADVDLMDFRSEQPQLQGFITKELKGDRSHRQGEYVVHEFRYMITPTIEGSSTIAPIRAKVAERTETRDSFFGTFFDKPKWSQIVSNGVDLSIKPLPHSSDLVGDFNISTEIDTQNIKPNKPINLTINISGEGSLEDFDNISYDIDGVTIYSDDATISSQVIDSKIVSKYSKKFVFIGDSNFTIPSKSISSFNYKTNKSKELTIDSYDIVVKGKSRAVVVQSATPPQTTIQPTEDNPLPKEESLDTTLLLIGSFLLGALSMLGVLKLPLLWSYIRPKKVVNSLEILYPHTNDSHEVEEMVRRLYAKRGGDKSIKIDKKELAKLVERYR